jgi:cell division protein FtsA
MNEVIAGLDIGTTNVRAVVWRLDANGLLDILAAKEVACEGLKKGLVMNLSQTAHAINIALETVADEAEITIGSINVNVSGTVITNVIKKGSATRSSNGKVFTVEDVRRLTSDVEKGIHLPGYEVLHSTPQEYRIPDRGSNIPDPVGNIGVSFETDIHVILSSEDEFRNLRASFDESDFSAVEIEHRVFSPIACAMSCLSEEEIEEGVAIVDIGGGLTEVAIYHNKILRHTAVIPYGGNDITKDIQEGCGIKPQMARAVKEGYGIALPDEVKANEVVLVPGTANRPAKDVSLKNVAIIMHERLNEIAALVTAEIHNSGFERKLSSGIVLTGASAEIFQLTDLFKIVSGFDTRIGRPVEKLGSVPNSIVKSPSFATAVGLVWRGYKEIDFRSTRYGFIKPASKPKSKSVVATPIVEPTISNTTVVDKQGFWQRFVDKAAKVINDTDDLKGKDDI